MIVIQSLIERIRPVSEKDKDLPRYSYSKLEVFKNCPLSYKCKYIDKKRTKDTSIALEMGSLCHKVLELKGAMVAEQKNIDYKFLDNILLNGLNEENENVPGISQIKKKYFDKWNDIDNASGLSYEEKMKVFDKVLHDEMEDTEWMPKYLEMSFEFVWDNRAVIHGFIDRIDTKNNDDGTIAYRTVDYKTSKKVFDNSKLPTSLQFGIYALAILNTFKTLPTESLYRFVLIDDAQFALTKGWEKRLLKAINKVLDDVETCEKKNIFIPKATPLCYWCNFCKNNPEATIYRNECQYFSKWMPNSKTFEVNQKYNALEQTETKRKLIF